MNEIVDESSPTMTEFENQRILELWQTLFTYSEEGTEIPGMGYSVFWEGSEDMALPKRKI